MAERFLLLGVMTMSGDEKTQAKGDARQAKEKIKDVFKD